MREFVISSTGAVAVAVGWFVLWAIALRAFDIPFFPSSPEERAMRRERIVRMGKVRFILIFGMLGFGLAMGLGLAVADRITGGSVSWLKLVLMIVLGGWWYGARTWNESYRGEIPFPPAFPPQR